MKSVIGVNNPYGLVQKAGKRKTHRRHKRKTRKGGRKTRKY